MGGYDVREMELGTRAHSDNPYMSWVKVVYDPVGERVAYSSYEHLRADSKVIGPLLGRVSHLSDWNFQEFVKHVKTRVVAQLE